jgi:histidine ammonia-lyase
VTNFPPHTSTPIETVELSASGLDADQVVAVARMRVPAALGPAAREAMERSAAVVARLVDSEEPVYGVSTGFGSLAAVPIPAPRREERQRGGDGGGAGDDAAAGPDAGDGMLGSAAGGR